MVQDKAAMQAYAALTKSERRDVRNRAENAKTKAEMKAIVLSLYDLTSAVEYF